MRENETVSIDFSSMSYNLSNKIKVAVIGTGKMADEHIKVLKDIGNLNICSITGRSYENTKNASIRNGIKSFFIDVDKMISEVKPDALIVAVSHSSVFEVYKKILSFGIPVLLEKPAGYNLDQIKEFIEISSQKNTLVMVGVNRRFTTSVLNSYFVLNQFGKILNIYVETNEPIYNYRSRLQFEKWVYDNWITANSIHAIDLFRFYGGEPARILFKEIKINESEFPKYTSVIEFENGMTGLFNAVFNSAGGFGMKIYGEGLTANMIPLENGFINFSSNHIVNCGLSGKDLIHKPGLYYQNFYFLNTISENGNLEFPASDLEDHYKTLKLINQLITEN